VSSSITVVCDDALAQKDPLVSVCIITYNQAEYIEEAVDSVLEQQVDFEYELIIGDDCSTDGTREILKRYQCAHPDRIRLNLHDEHYDGIPARKNMVTNLESARGKYVALLDGDDYWISPDKLQRQTEFLEAHPGVSLSSHDSLIVLEGKAAEDSYGRSGKVYESELHPSAMSEDRYLDVNEVINQKTDEGESFSIPAGSMVFRRQFFDPVPDWYWKVWYGDRVMQMYCASHGPVYYHSDLKSCYRRNEGSVMIQFEGTMDHIRARIDEIRVLSDAVPSYDQKHQMLNPAYRSKMMAHWRKGQPLRATLAFGRSVFHHALYRLQEIF